MTTHHRGDRPNYQQNTKAYPSAMSNGQRKEGPMRSSHRNNWNPHFSGGRGGSEVDALTQALHKQEISAATPSERKGLCIIDPSSGQEVKVEPKNDGKMTRIGGTGKGDGKGGGKGRGKGNGRTSTIGGRAVTTIGGKQMTTTYALYDPTSNDYEESPKGSPTAPSPDMALPLPSSLPAAIPPSDQPLSSMPRPYTEPPIRPVADVPTSEPSVTTSQALPASLGGGVYHLGGIETLGSNMPGASTSSQSSQFFPDYTQGSGQPQANGQPDYLKQLGGFSSAPSSYQSQPAGIPASQSIATPLGLQPQLGAISSMQHLSAQNGIHHQPHSGSMPPYNSGMQAPAGLPQATMFSGAAQHYSQVAPVPHQAQHPVGYPGQKPTEVHDTQNDQHSSGGIDMATRVAAKPEPEPEVPSKMSKTQLKNQKKHQRARERKAKELREQAEDAVLAWRTSVLAAPLAGMGFPRERCFAAVCACSDGKCEVDLERCVAWLLSDQLFKGKHADLDISADIQKMSEVESHGFCRSDVERAVLAHGGDVDTACRALQNGTFTVSAMSA